MIIIGFYTNHEYESWGERLKKTVMHRGYPIDLEKMPDHPNYNQNVHQKALLIEAKLRQYYPRPVLYIDVDAEVVGSLQPLEIIIHDFAAYFWQDTQLLGGTLLFQNNDNTRQLVHRWIKENQFNPEKTDQENLQAVLAGTLSITKLDPAYCWIESAMRPAHPDTVPVIFHYGISRHRWMKGVENGAG